MTRKEMIQFAVEAMKNRLAESIVSVSERYPEGLFRFKYKGWVVNDIFDILRIEWLDKSSKLKLDNDDLTLLITKHPDFYDDTFVSLGHEPDSIESQKYIAYERLRGWTRGYEKLLENFEY
ncbi:gp56 [Sphingomonas phage PAU]|uniref:gp56 n=1 Tax=Sphingomonas phage PAU TaxID=1150991 RepID=UPI00025731C2|nr:gp56 [Sphingomonas phage PAU]AFF28054.1 gp56 [Sphingomonas phage PAU]